MTALALRRRLPVLHPPDVSYRALRVWQRNRDVYLNIWRSEVIWPIVDPLITLVALGIGLGDFVELGVHQSYVHFIAPGLLVVFPMWVAAGETGWGSFFRMENQRTFEAIVATPVSVDDVTSGEILWGASRAVISVAYILVLVAAFGAVESALVVLVLPLSLLSGLMFAAISLCYTAVARSISSLNYFFAAFITPQFWLAGIFFPLNRLPQWVQTVAWFTPAYHAVHVYRGLIKGEPQWAHLADIAWMVVVTAVFYAVALQLMRRRLVK
ncbi:MAG TPA: ABC transporter permease [Dehalococcoidia bacterium]|nr:ABC transporter permease [Dehalococcoidia bacterium]